MFSHISLSLSRNMISDFFRRPFTVKKECTAILNILNHVIFIHVCRTVTCNKISLINKVCRLNRSLTKTKVRCCNTTWLLWIIIKICLSIHRSMITDNLNRVLVSTYSTISTKTPELTWSCSGRSCVSCLCTRKWCISNIIYDTNCKSSLILICKNSKDISRSCILRTKTITTIKDFNALEFCSL